MVEGGAVPVDRNLTWKECRFNLFDYKTKAGDVVATTCALRINYVDDDGQEFEQQYSVSDPERFIPSQDGKTLVAVGSAEVLSKSSNFYVLMNALVNAGFPENRLEDDVSTLDGLITYNIGMPMPKRAGLASSEPAEGGRERILSVPDRVIKLPWEKGKGKAAPAKAKAPATDEGDDEEVTEAALAFVADAVEEIGTITRQQLATRLFKKEAKNPNKDAIATLLFKPEFQANLLANGYTVDGEEVSKAE
jgi:hypothetical protein